jgi:hypothetical protein
MNDDITTMGLGPHFTPQFYLRMFSIDPKIRKSRQEIYRLGKDKSIRKYPVKDICTYPEYNTEEQDNIFSVIESEIAPALRKAVNLHSTSYILDDNDIYLLYKLTALLMSGSLRTRIFFENAEELILSKIFEGNEFPTINREQSISGRLDVTLLLMERILETLMDSYKAKTLHFKERSLITSDSPVYLVSTGEQHDFIIDFGESKTEYRGMSKDKILFRLASEVKAVRITSECIHLPLSSNTLLSLIKNDISDDEFVKGLNVFYREGAVNGFNAMLFGNCHNYALGHSEDVLRDCGGLINFSTS